jgi:rubredoxin
MCSQCDWDYPEEQIEEEEVMAQPGAKRFEEWKRNFPEPKFMTGDELPVETDNVVWMDLPPIQPRLVADTDWNSVELCRRDAQARLDTSKLRRALVNTFWATLAVAALLAGAVYAVKALYSAVQG